MIPKISVGIDVGTTSIKVVVAEADTEELCGKPRIIGFGHSTSEGLRRGYITNTADVAKSIKIAVSQAEKSSGYRINKAFFSVGGIGLEGTKSKASLYLGDRETFITKEEINRALKECETSLPEFATKNRDLLHVIPLSFKIDGKPVLGKVEGLVGKEIEAEAFFITILSQHVLDLIESAKLAGIQVEDVMASPIAAGIPLLNRSQQIVGSGLLTIGGETSSLVVYENGTAISLEVFPVGGSDITNDIALGLKISIEDAERVKHSRPESVPYPRKRLEDIVTARLEDIFDLVQAHLKKIGKQGLLPAGILITGGGACGYFIEDTAKEELRLPARKIGIKFDGETKVPIKDGVWAGAYGLSILGIINKEDNDYLGNQLGLTFNRTKKGLVSIFKAIVRTIRKILP